jgi:site-specific recombinase XerD
MRPQRSPPVAVESASVAADPVSLAPDPELAALVDSFLASVDSWHTRETYAADLAQFLTWLTGEGKHPRDVSRPDIVRYRDWLLEGRRNQDPIAHERTRAASATLMRKLSSVRAFYRYLSEQGAVPGSPAAGVMAPRAPTEPRARALTDDHVGRLLAKASEHGHETEAMVCLLVNGLRISELCAADVEDLRCEHDGGSSLVVRGKDGTEVTLALDDRTEQALLKTVRGRSTGPLFRRRGMHSRSAPAAVRYDREALYRVIAELAAQAGLRGDAAGMVRRIGAHRLRHTFVARVRGRDEPHATC